MKHRLIKKTFFFLAAVLVTSLLTGCQNDDTIVVVEESIDLSQSQFTFSFQGDEKCNIYIRVDPVQSWKATVENGSEWLVLEDQTDASLTFATKGENRTGDELQATVKITTSTGRVVRTLLFSQHHKEASPTIETEGETRLQNRFRYFEGYTNAVMSADGRYVGLIKHSLVGEYWQSEVQIYDSFTGIFHLVSEPLTQSSTVPSGISNDGTFLVYHENPDPILNGITSDKMTVAYTIDGAQMIPKMPANHPQWGKYSEIQGLNISADGKVIVGLAYISGRDSELGNCSPFKWVEGEPEMLPSPEKVITGVRDVRPGEVCWPRGCNEDGSVIYGNLWGNILWAVPLVWKDGQVNYIGEDLAKWKDETGTVDTWWDWSIAYEGPYALATSYCISPNGRYIVSGLYNIPGIFIYDTEMQTSEKVSSRYSEPRCIIDDKTISSPENTGYGGEVILADGTIVSVEQYMESVMGASLSYTFSNLFIAQLNNNHDSFLATFRDTNAYRYIHFAPEGAGDW